MKHHKHVLPNGLTVVTVPIKGVESITTMAIVGAGSRYEEKSTSGISHFLEHMAFKGTDKRPTALEIATLLDGIGAESNAFTSKEVTAYYIKSSASHLDTALDVLSDVLLHSKFDQKEIDKEKGVILEEFSMYEDTPMRKIGDIFENLLYGDQPLGWDILGDRDVIRGAQREDFVNYMKKLYSSHRMSVIVAGKVDSATVNRKVEEYFGSFDKFETPGAPEVVEKDSGPKLLIKTKKTEQAHFALGVRTVGMRAHNDRYALSVLSTILGGGMSSRLFHEVREKRGLAYYVRAFSEKHTDCGYLATFSGVDPTRIDEAVKVVAAEMRKIATRGAIQDKELTKAKEYIKGHFVMGLEDTREVAVHYGVGQTLEGELRDPEAVLKKIESVTAEKVAEVAEKYLSKDFHFALIGNFDDKERFEKLIS